MRVVFVGATGFGLRCLGAARRVPGCNVVGVVTAPRQFSISYRPQGVVNLLHADVESYCASSAIPCASTSVGMAGEALFEAVQGWKPDAFLVAGWYHLLPKRWRELAPAFGLHASLLPDYRGGAPLVWAMINGERRTGITFFKLDDGADSGPIVGQAETDILETDTIATLYGRIEELGLALLDTHLPAICAGTATLVAQPGSGGCVFPQRSPDNGLIDWRMSARDVYNFVRAQTKPYPGAFTTCRGRRLTVWSALLPAIDAPPNVAAGSVLAHSRNLLVKTGRGVLQIEEVGYDGQTLPGRDFKSIAGAGAILGT